MTGGPYALPHLIMNRDFGSSSAKHLMTILAIYADEELSCFPSQQTLAADTGMAERTVRRTLAYLEEQGVLVRKARFYRNGQGRTSDRIFLSREAIERLPETARYSKPADMAALVDQPANDDSQPAIHDSKPANDARLTGHGVRVTTSRTTRKNYQEGVQGEEKETRLPRGLSDDPMMRAFHAENGRHYRSTS